MSAPNPGNTYTLFSSLDGAVEDLWVVGTRKSKGSSFKSLAEHLTADGWKVVPTPNIRRRHNILSGVTYLSSAEVWAVGSAQRKTGEARNLVMRWDGTSWSRIGVPRTDRAVNSLVSIDAVPSGELPIDPVATTELWAVGADARLSGAARAQILHYDGTEWHRRPGPAVGSPHSLISVLALSPTDVWAVGSKRSGGQTRPLAMHFDGSAWTVVPVPDPPTGALTSLAGGATDDVWAAGASAEGEPVVLHWDGSAWSRSQLPEAPGKGGFLAVTQEADGDLRAAGYTTSNERIVTLITHRSGETWVREDTPNAAWLNLLLDITAVPDGAVWAVGYSMTRAAVANNLLLRCG